MGHNSFIPYNIYLSGGMKSNWQDKIIEALSDINARIKFIDPRKNGLKNPVSYTYWDINSIRNSDIIFAYLESDNPSGLGLATEVGYGAGFGCLTIFINEKSKDKHTHFIEEVATLSYRDLNEGIAMLKNICENGLVRGIR